MVINSGLKGSLWISSLNCSNFPALLAWGNFEELTLMYVKINKRCWFSFRHDKHVRLLQYLSGVSSAMLMPVPSVASQSPEWPMYVPSEALISANFTRSFTSLLLSTMHVIISVVFGDLSRFATVCVHSPTKLCLQMVLVIQMMPVS